MHHWCFLFMSTRFCWLSRTLIHHKTSMYTCFGRWDSFAILGLLVILVRLLSVLRYHFADFRSSLHQAFQKSSFNLLFWFLLRSKGHTIRFLFSFLGCFGLELMHLLSFFLFRILLLDNVLQWVSFIQDLSIQLVISDYWLLILICYRSKSTLLSHLSL